MCHELQSETSWRQEKDMNVPILKSPFNANEDKTVILCHHLERSNPGKHYPLLFVPLCKHRPASNGMKEYWYNVFSSRCRESDDDWGQSTKSEWKMRHNQWKSWCKVGYGPMGNFFSVELFSGSGLCRGEDEYGVKDLKLVGKYFYANDALATRSLLIFFQTWIKTSSETRSRCMVIIFQETNTYGWAHHSITVPSLPLHRGFLQAR